MRKALVASVIILTLFQAGTGLFQGRVRSVRRPRRVSSPLPRSPVPREWRWDRVDGTNFLTVLRNQHIPTYCGSCWAHAATSALSDRIKIMRNASWPDFNIAPQVLISCGPDDGCHGGDTGLANEFMAKQDGITDETCSIYRARGHDNGLPCSKLAICETCDPGKAECSTPPVYHKYRVDEYADVEGKTAKEQEMNMMAEIYHRGPIACGIAVTEDLYHNYTGGVYYDKTNNTDIDHDISVVGYGHDPESGWDYWLVRNSWGTYWGEQGFFRLRRGVNNLGIEGGTCTWATPVDTWSGAATPTEREEPPRPVTPRAFRSKLADLVLKLLDQMARSDAEGRPYARAPCAVFGRGYAGGPLLETAEPKSYVADAELPKAWDWRNVDGVNYVSWTVNQHIPQYCGSCWAQATASALADRFIVADPKRYANLALSPQVILNCRGGGSCEGGAPEEVYEFVHKYGIPDMTCQQYDAKDHTPVKDCSVPDMGICRDCTWPPPPPGEMGNCFVRKNFTRYTVSEYGHVNGADNMKKEIFKRGPIACGIDVTMKFEKYNGGIYSQKLPRPPILNHEISVVGWGYDEEKGKEFWIGRNSWGSYWGEYGFFRIDMHENNLGIETACVWAVPKVS